MIRQHNYHVLLCNHLLPIKIVLDAIVDQLLITSFVELLQYRSEIYEECSRNPDFVYNLYQILLERFIDD